MNHETLPAQFTIHYQGAELPVTTKCVAFKQFIIKLANGKLTEVFLVTDKLGKVWHEAFKGETSFAKELGTAIEASLSIIQQLNAILNFDQKQPKLLQAKAAEALLHR
ncbi:hypothetical protein HNQ91_002253 [Filimonas zeae]|uniref:Uncharacterized protein n=1 Tax=Filimonas zeae TaxID=1737353 RepID=A0A917IXK9_9BACT|nr:hypothetical protein [Filimonas zeae]MDR6339202.1 hypothetical protein [Filimonas zeae]GGH64632.1 hypothetical protein GCM10011379_16900 [Filimonas zeae]